MSESFVNWVVCRVVLLYLNNEPWKTFHCKAPLLTICEQQWKLCTRRNSCEMRIVCTKWFIVIWEHLAQYTLFVADHNDETTLKKKKEIEFCETWWKQVCALFVIDSRFRKYEFHPRIFFTTAKKVLGVHQETAYHGKHISWKFLVKCSQITMNHSLLTFCILHELSCFVRFCCCLKIVCSGLSMKNFVKLVRQGR